MLQVDIKSKKRQNFENINRYRVRYFSGNQKYFIRRYLLSFLAKCNSFLAFPTYVVLPKNLVTLKRPIFIIGCSRSGTTLFLDLFRYHSDLCNWSEAGQIFEAKYYDPDIDHLKTRECATEAEKRRLRFSFGLYARFTQKPRFVNKHPQNSLRIPYLKAIFPDAQFIHLIRDARAVVRSHLAQVRRDRYRQSIPFGSFPKPPRWREYLNLTPIEQYAHQWVDLIVTIRDYAAELLTPEDYIEVRYEDFCSNPQRILEIVDQFCGLSPDRRDHSKFPGQFLVRNDCWQREFSNSDLQLLENVTGPLMRELGYI